MNLLWMTSNLFSLIPAFLTVSFQNEHPPSILQ